MRLHILAFVALAAGSAPAQTVRLRFRPPVGRAYAYIAKVDMTMRVPSQPAPVAFSETIPMILRAVSRVSGTTVIETKTGKARLDAPAGSPMLKAKSQVERTVSGMIVRTTVDELGNLKSVGTAGGPAAKLTAGLGGGIAKGAQGVSFPAKAVRVGESWGAKVDMGQVMGGASGGALKAKGQVPIVYRLTARKAGVATIAVNAGGTVRIESPSGTIETTTRMAGTIQVEEATGMLVSNVTTTDSTVKLGTKGTSKQHVVMTMRRR